MNPLVKLLPFLTQTKLFSKHKKWLVLVAAIAGGYQMLSPNGIGANWGIPSIDTFYAEPRDILISRVEAASDAQQETAEENLITAMRNAESKTKPVLGALKDQVLFVKHNLNMQAISSLKQETTIIEQDVSALIKEMEASIAEAESFIQSIRS